MCCADHTTGSTQSTATGGSSLSEGSLRLRSQLATDGGALHIHRLVRTRRCRHGAAIWRRVFAKPLRVTEPCASVVLPELAQIEVLAHEHFLTGGRSCACVGIEYSPRWTDRPELQPVLDTLEARELELGSAAYETLRAPFSESPPPFAPGAPEKERRQQLQAIRAWVERQ